MQTALRMAEEKLFLARHARELLHVEQHKTAAKLDQLIIHIGDLEDLFDKLKEEAKK